MNEARVKLRTQIQQAAPVTESSLDSNLKKNVAYVKRLKTSIHASDASESLVKESRTLSLERYTSELVSAAVEGVQKCKTTQEFINALETIAALHVRFPDAFTKQFTAALLGLLKLPPKSALNTNADQRDKEETARIARQRGLLRLLGEMECVGIVTSTGALGSVTFSTLKELLSTDKDFLLTTVPLGTAFVKNLSIYLPESLPTPAETASEDVIPLAEKEKFQALLKTYLAALSKKTLADHLTLQETDKRNHEAYIKFGEIFEDRAAAYEKLVKSWDKAWNGVVTLCEALGEEKPELPVLPAASIVTGVGASLVNMNPETAGENGSTSRMWTDEEERSFYRDLIDLQDQVPISLLGGAKPAKKEERASTDEKSDKIEADEKELLMETDQQENKAREALEAATEQDAIASAPAARLSDLFARLPEMISKPLIDQAAVEFALVNSKAARNRLVKFLSGVSKSRSDLLPFYGRLVATLDPYMPDVASSLLSILEDDLRYLQKRKNVELRDVRPKTLRFFSELIKFDLVPTHTILHWYKVFIDDMTHYNVDSICILLENCGRFVFRSEATSARITTLLDTLLRKKAAQNLDPRQVIMLENAYYQCNPPARPAIAPKERSEMHLFIHYLMYTLVSRATYEKAFKLIRMLDWNDEEVTHRLRNCFTKIWKAKYGNVNLFALLLYDLGKHHQDFVISVIDTILENVRCGLETNNFKYNQNRVTTIKFLGELYNFRSIDAKIVFDVLWLLVTFGYPDGRPSPEIVSAIDAPDDWFRVRLVCVLLDTVATHLDRGSAKAKLDNFLTFFQLYVNCKRSVPMDIEFMLGDTLESLRPKLVLAKTFEEAVEAVDSMLANHVNLRGQEEADDVEELEPERPVPDASEDGSPSDSGADDSSDDQFELEEEDEAVILESPKKIGLTEEEEAEFARELAKLMSEPSSQNKGSSARGNRAEVGLPILRKELADVPAASDEKHMVFTMLTRRGARPQTHNMEIPADSAIATQTRQQQAQNKAEQQQLKKLVLQSEQRQNLETAQQRVAQDRSNRKNFS